MKKKKILGWHDLIDFHRCDPKILDSPRSLKALLEKAALKGGAQIVKSVFHRFSPFGVSGILVIAESHISIHTWPEYGSATVDIFSCTQRMKSDLIVKELGRGLKPEKTVRRKIIRGRLR